MHGRILVLLFALSLLACMSGCVAAIPSVANDERTLADQYSDAQIEASIKGSLVQEDPIKATNINVYSLRGHVFLVGAVDSAYRALAQKAAQKTAGVRHLTTHWFEAGATHLASDTQIEATIDSNLLLAKEVTSTRVNVDVWGGHVVLLGIMESKGEIDRAIRETRGVTGVKSVKSYLMTNAQSLQEATTPPAVK